MTVAGWMLYSTAVACCVALGAAMLERVVGARTASRRLVWLGALCMTLALTASVPRPLREVGIAAVGPNLPAEVSFPGSAASYWFVDSNAATVARLDQTLLVGWVVMSFVALTLLLGSVVRLWRRRRRWERVALDGFRVRIADDVGPAVVGLLGGEVVMPRWVLTRAPEERWLILEHERQHVLSRDPLMLFVALLLASLLPWNPGVWLLVHRLRRSVEIDCDHRVVRAGGRPREYASLLIEMGSSAVPPVVAQIALVERGSDLERRVAAILSLSRPVSRRNAATRALLGSALMVAPWMGPQPLVRIPKFSTEPAVSARDQRVQPGSVRPVPFAGRAAAGAGRVSGGERRGWSGGAIGWTGPSGASHVIDSDTLVHLVALHHPTLSSNLTSYDSVAILFAFDDEARMQYTTVVGFHDIDFRDPRTSLPKLFPDLAGKRQRGGGWISRIVTPPGEPIRRVAIIFGVYGPGPWRSKSRPL